jgi:hypothetical protein
MFSLFTCLVRPCLNFQSKKYGKQVYWKFSYNIAGLKFAAYNPFVLGYNHIFQPFKTMVLPFHERSESDYDVASHRKITESYFIDCFPGTGTLPSQLYTKLDSNMTHLSSNVPNRNRPGCAHITGASSPGQLNFFMVGPWYKTRFISPLLAPRILRYLLELWKISDPPLLAVLDLNFRQKKGFLSFPKIQTALRAPYTLS